MAEELTPRERRAWEEYLAWARGAIPSQYAQTEEQAWRRLQNELLAIRTPAGTFPDPVLFTPDEGVDIEFTPDDEREAGEQWRRWSGGWGTPPFSPPESP